MEPHGTIRSVLLRSLVILLACAGAGATASSSGGGHPQAQRTGNGFSYLHDEVSDVPWSIHVLKVDRSRTDLEFHTTIAAGTGLGLSTLTEQLKTLSPSLGQPMAAINGDFWRDGRQPPGDPMGLFIHQGELVSAPCERPCFWIDAEGQPHSTNVLAQFTVTWPGGTTAWIGLNEERTNNGAVLFTPSVGTSTKTKGGRELILERTGDSAWLPLRIGRSYTARVRQIREAGDTKLSADTMVLSLDSGLAERIPELFPGATLKLAMDTTPGLGGVTTAIGGGPMLVRDGKSVSFSGSQPRHPRTAVGWNDKHFFLVVVDGRQGNLSVGMSLPELAAYFVKLGATRAMNLDGGGSATFWVRGQVMNSPCYGHERPMANALVLMRKPRTPERTRTGGTGQ